VRCALVPISVEDASPGSDPEIRQAGETQDRSWGVLKEGSILVSSLGWPPVEKAARHNVRAAGYRARPNPAPLNKIGRLIDDGQVRVVVDRVFSLTGSGAAQGYLEQEHVRESHPTICRRDLTTISRVEAERFSQPRTKLEQASHV
jgi:hypothetical protein